MRSVSTYKTNPNGAQPTGAADRHAATQLLTQHPGLDDAAKVGLLYEVNNHFVRTPWLAGRVKRSRGTQAEFERSIGIADAALQQGLGVSEVTVHSQLPTAAEDVLDLGLLLTGSSSGFQPHVLLAPHGSKAANGTLRKQPKKADQHRLGQAAIEYGSFNSINPTYKPKAVQAFGLPAGVSAGVIRNLSTCKVVFAPSREPTAHQAAAGAGSGNSGSSGASTSHPGVLSRVNRVFVVVSDLPEDIKLQLQQPQHQQGFLPWVEQSVYVPGREGYVGAIALYEFNGQSEEQQLLGRQALSIHLSPPSSQQGLFLPSAAAASPAAAAGGSGTHSGSHSSLSPNPEMHQILDILASDSDIPEVLGSPATAAAAAAAAEAEAAAAAAEELVYSTGLMPISDALVQQDMMEDMQLQSAACYQQPQEQQQQLPMLATAYAQQEQFVLLPKQQQQQRQAPHPWQQQQAQQLQQLQELLQQLQLPPGNRSEKQLQLGALQDLLQPPQLQQQQIQQTVQQKVLQQPCKPPQWCMQVSRQLSACSELLKVLLLSICAGNHAGYSELLWVQLLRHIEQHNRAVAEAAVDGLANADRYRIADVLSIRNDVGGRTLLHMLVSDFPQMLLLPEGCQQLSGPDGPLEVRGPQQLVLYLQANAAAATGVPFEAANVQAGPAAATAAAAAATTSFQGGADLTLPQLVQFAAASANSGSSSGLLPQERVRLLQLVRAHALGPDSSNNARWQQVTRQCNKNGDTAWLTACHWCIPEVLQSFLSDPDFDLHLDMLATTKKHRLFYHKICRQMAERTKQGLHTSRHMQALYMTLTALADKLLQDRCLAAGPAGAVALQAMQAARQQQQQPGDGRGCQTGSASLLPLKRPHAESTRQLQLPGQDAVSASTCDLPSCVAGKRVGVSPAVAAVSDSGRVVGASGLWLTSQPLCVLLELQQQVVQELHLHIYRMSKLGDGGGYLDHVVEDLFGFQMTVAGPLML